jgi:molecular chaperone DnaJ
VPYHVLFPVKPVYNKFFMLLTVGKYFQISTCLKCKGEGKIIVENCKRCLGQGRVLVHRKVKVDVPAGVTDGSTIQIEGKGNVDNET